MEIIQIFMNGNEFFLPLLSQAVSCASLEAFSVDMLIELMRNFMPFSLAKIYHYIPTVAEVGMILSFYVNIAAASIMW